MFRVGTDGIRDPHASGGGRGVCSGNTGKRISIIPLNCGEGDVSAKSSESGGSARVGLQIWGACV